MHKPCALLEIAWPLEPKLFVGRVGSVIFAWHDLMCRLDDIVTTSSQSVICAVLSKATPILAHGWKAALADQQTNKVFKFQTN